MGGAKIIVVANVEGRLSCLYLLAGDSHTWTIPGGGQEDFDRDQQACAERELEEEAGMTGRVEHLDRVTYLHVFEGDPQSYESPRIRDPNNDRFDGFEHIDQAWAPLEEDPREYLRHGRGRCSHEWNQWVRPYIDKVKERCAHLVREQYSIKTRLL